MRKQSRQSGIAMILVMVVVVAAGILGMSYLSAASVRQVSSANLLRAARAKYLAECGVQHAMDTLVNNAATLSGSQACPLGPYYVDSGSDTYRLWGASTGTANIYLLGGVGYSGGVTQYASATVRCPCYDEFILAENPLTYWRLGETSGTTAVDRTGRYNGIYSYVTTGQAGAIAGDSNTAGRFNGISSRVSISDNPFDFTTSFSVSAWLKVNALVNNQIVASKLQGSNGWQFEADRAILSAKIGNKTYNATSAGVTANQWVHVVFVYDRTNSRMRFYSGGAPVGTSATTSTPGSNSHDLELGHETNANNCLNGYLDEVAVFNYALTDAQVLRIYRAGKAPVKIVNWNE